VLLEGEVISLKEVLLLEEGVVVLQALHIFIFSICFVTRLDHI